LLIASHKLTICQIVLDRGTSDNLALVCCLTLFGAVLKIPMSDSLMSLLAQAWALSETSRRLPSSSRSSARQGRRKQSRRGLSTTVGGMNPTKRSDLALKPPTTLNVPKSVPVNVAQAIVWDTLKIDSVITATTGGVTETNFVFQMNQHPQSSSWLALFDQYCIAQVSIEFDAAVPNGSTAIPVRLYTAIDFDNAGNISTVQAIEDFSSCEVTPIVAGFRHLRTVRPCVKNTTQGSGSNSQSTVTRQWIDSGSPDVQHFGVRSIVPASATAVVNVTQTVWYAFRNHI